MSEELFTPPSTGPLLALDFTEPSISQVRDKANLSRAGFLVQSGDAALAFRDDVEMGRSIGSTKSAQGNTTRIYCNDVADIQFPKDFCVSFWFLDITRNNTSRVLLAKSAWPGSPGWYGSRVYTENGNLWLMFGLANNNYAATMLAPSPTINVWTHYAASRKNGLFRMFKDGVLYREVALDYPYMVYPQDNGPLVIASYANGGNVAAATWSSLGGYIARIRMYNYAHHWDNFTPSKALYG